MIKTKEDRYPQVIISLRGYREPKRERGERKVVVIEPFIDLYGTVIRPLRVSYRPVVSYQVIHIEPNLRSGRGIFNATLHL